MGLLLMNFSFFFSFFILFAFQLWGLSKFAVDIHNLQMPKSGKNTLNNILTHVKIEKKSVDIHSSL